MNLPGVSVLCVAAAIQGALGPFVAAAQAQPRSALVGVYRHTGGRAERQAVELAIDDVVAEMTFLIRWYARKQLRETNRIPGTIAIAASDGWLSVTLGPRTYTAPIDGRAVKTTGITGDELELHYAVAEGRIEQWFVGEHGGRVNTLTLEKERLVLRVRVFSAQLPKDLRYLATYERGSLDQ